MDVRHLSDEIVDSESSFRVTHVYNPENGRWKILPFVPVGERLTPSQVGEIERALGVTTGFSSI